MNRTYVVGVGMTRFEKPATRLWDYPDMAREAGQAALDDAGLGLDAIEEAYAGYANGESCCGQRALAELGVTDIPVVNVNNACATGSTALFLARRAVQLGGADCVLAVGFEKMERGSLGLHFTDRTVPVDRHFTELIGRRGFGDEPPTVQLFGHVAREHMERYGTSPEVFAKIAEKNHRHSVHNPNSQFQQAFSREQIEGSAMIFDPLTKLQCCPTSDGGAAAIVASERFVDEHDLGHRAVEIAGQALATDGADTFDGTSAGLVGFHVTRRAAQRAYEEAGAGPNEAQVVELHDCFSSMELIQYEALGLCAEGEAATLVDNDDTTYGGRWVVNPSGGLISKGHPLGATGLAQCAELTWQLRGEAGGRQVAGATVAIQHNAGLGGATVVSVYRREVRP